MNAVTSLQYPTEEYSPYGNGADFPAEGREAGSVWRSGAALLLVLAVGTGGQCNWQFIQRRQTLGYPVANVEVHERVHAHPIRTAAADLKQARALFGASVSDLAALFGVTRQTIYDWLGGEQQPRQGHQARMTALLDAAGTLEAAGFRVSRRALKQPLSDGRTLFDRVRAGESLEGATAELVTVFRRELGQREALAHRLANRPGTPLDLTDLGVPHLCEEL
jgi:DNA-binding transcriptional regulator YiaG